VLKLRSRKILIVDPNDKTRQLLTENLEKEEYQVIAAENGKEGFELVNRERPDLVISDIFMNNMNGFELCQRIRDMSDVPNVPFVFFTSTDDMLTEVRAFRAGADEYLVKSQTKRQDLLIRIENMMGNIDAFEKVKATLHEGFLGKLGDISVSDVLELLVNTKKTGNLLISDGTLEGNVFFLKGNILNAELGEVSGEEAIYDMVFWEDGFFKFAHTEVPRKHVISTPTTKVLRKCRRLVGADE